MALSQPDPAPDAPKPEQQPGAKASLLSQLGRLRAGTLALAAVSSPGARARARNASATATAEAPAQVDLWSPASRPVTDSNQPLSAYVKWLRPSAYMHNIAVCTPLNAMQ